MIVYLDGVGIRPAMLELGERLATYGYFVLLPDLFYRAGPYEPIDGHTVFSDPMKRKILMEKFIGPATPAAVMSDTSAFLDYLESEPDAKRGPVGTTGYCMGGAMSFTAGGTYSERIAFSQGGFGAMAFRGARPRRGRGPFLHRGGQ